MKTLTSEKLSKTMAHALRHAPEAYSLTLTAEGFVAVAELAQKLSQHFEQTVTVEAILGVIEADSKQRYTLVGTQVRAAQGHSFPVDLGMTPIEPPAVLFHGTIAAVVPSIMKQGLIPGSRQFVHLSSNLETATTVASRRGKPVILTINAAAAHAAGVKFYQSENNVWLVAALPAEFISI